MVGGMLGGPIGAVIGSQVRSDVLFGCLDLPGFSRFLGDFVFLAFPFWAFRGLLWNVFF